MFNTAEFLAASGPMGWPSHCRFPTINWPTVSGSLNDFRHKKSKEGFTLDPLPAKVPVEFSCPQSVSAVLPLQPQDFVYVVYCPAV